MRRAIQHMSSTQFLDLLSRGILSQAEPLLFRPSWAAMESELAGAMHHSLRAYWARLEARQAEASDFINPTAEVII